MTLAALFAALCVVLLYIASIWPTGQLGLVAVASLFVAAGVIEGGKSGIKVGLAVFVVSSFIGMLILPNRVAPLLFIIFFGYYPVLKSLLERISKNMLQWVLKLLVFNAALAIIWFALNDLFLGFMDSLPIVSEIDPQIMSFAALVIAANIVFVIYDYGFTKLIWFYIQRVSSKIK